MTIDAKRLELMTEGVEELEVWLLDILREGAASLAEAPPDHWKDLAARMVDAKLSGIARRIRMWPTIFAQEGGPQLLVSEIADLYLFAQAFRRFAHLPPARQTDLLSAAGVSQKKEVVRQQGRPVGDHWLVAGQYQGEEENLKFRRTWLMGETLGKTALLLDFAWGRNDFTEHWITGSVFAGAVIYYPSNYPQRALIASLDWSNRPYTMPSACKGGEAMLRQYAQALAADPWLHTFPCLLGGCRITRLEQEWFLLDSDRRQMPLLRTENGYWDLLALSAGNPVDIFGEWDGVQLLPLSASMDQRIISLTK